MELRHALQEQYHAGLTMLTGCVRMCPDSLWLEGAHPRTFWRIVFHTTFFTHLYLGQDEESFQPWRGRRECIHHRLWHEPGEVELYKLPKDAEMYLPSEMLAYIGFVDALVDSTVDHLDLDSLETGFSWYQNMSKLSHQLMNVRHLQGHVGQLSELLMAQGVDTRWVAN